jgi:23S rRNA G2445 N2-methylase RlmL
VASGIERGTRKRWRAVQEGEEVEIWANLIGLDFVCGLRLSGAEMRNRPYKLVHLPASLRPSVAAAMAWLTEPRPDDVFLDPTCGAGTLLIERDAFGAHGPLLAGDINAQALAAAAENVGPRFKPRQLFRWDARHLPLSAASVSKVAANLPFGVQIGDPRDNPALYRAVLGELDRVLTADGRAVLLTSAAELLRAVVRDCPGLRIRQTYAVNLLGQQAAIYVLVRPK